MKATKKDAKYKLHAKTRRCKKCAYFQSMNNSCSYVQGTISPNGTCKYWTKI